MCRVGLTSDEDEGRPGDVLPHERVLDQLALEVLRPGDVEGHVAGQAVCDVDGERQHQLGSLSHPVDTERERESERTRGTLLQVSDFCIPWNLLNEQEGSVLILLCRMLWVVIAW